jgi:hypothetical protein
MEEIKDRNEFLRQLMAAMTNGGGLFHETHYHDDDCPRLKGGECRCVPDVTYAKELPEQ